ncbi:short-chain dehydrogenase, putative [Talaromyces stipitatus ATCC 10500]|uniref:Short-chain dehydrogenase, putative n=1 Tax=Talaromyces stipitatus (strain ATCC 10500 / CBS 375.48 / QM 6759 / NRRL 1006) TaxID=441959 RepID=B8MID6_TALSN|nr:short-chain dehydrogenase, putative [Talaromyces stipitatus ATCC 10500]EED14620.1 short-chain dehydrogenase, putative [Talaromyces stipitatus ATCC 10500]
MTVPVAFLQAYYSLVYFATLGTCDKVFYGSQRIFGFDLHQMTKNFLITGAARGIGRGLSRLLLQRGHSVFLIDNSKTELEHTSDYLAQNFSSSKYSVALCDICEPLQIKSAIEKAAKFFNGHLDVLINNAAYTGAVGSAPFAELSLEMWNKSIQTNLTGAMLMSQGCLPMLRKGAGRQRGGCIIHMSSTRALQSEPNSEGYAATKAGLIGLTHAMACSLAGDSIAVNVILPGWIHVANECKDGGAWEDLLSKEDHRWHFSNRVGKVEDILRAVEYLADAEFVTGTEMVVDGGVTRKMVYPEV